MYKMKIRELPLKDLVAGLFPKDQGQEIQWALNVRSKVTRISERIAAYSDENQIMSLFMVIDRREEHRIQIVTETYDQIEVSWIADLTPGEFKVKLPRWILPKTVWGAVHLDAYLTYFSLLMFDDIKIEIVPSNHSDEKIEIPVKIDLRSR